MNLIQIKGCIKGGKNIIYYNKDIYRCYDELKDEYLSIYLTEPVPVKIRLIDAIKTISRTKKRSFSIYTTSNRVFTMPSTELVYITPSSHS